MMFDVKEENKGYEQSKSEPISIGKTDGKVRFKNMVMSKEKLTKRTEYESEGSTTSSSSKRL